MKSKRTEQQLTDSKNSNKQVNEIKKTMQDVKKEFNKDIDMLKYQTENLEMKSSISQIKTSLESLANRVEQIEIEYQRLKIKNRD
jgi:archaellum component FlaC